jgi:two-component system sensor histidine kinase/response regulator
MKAKATPHMLVVDDDPGSRKLLEGYLLAEGYNVSCAPDGATALAMTRQQIPDVMLLDVMMPVMTGHEVCREMKRNPETRLCQVMLVTALDSMPDRVQGLDTGADDYVSKPVRRDEFLAKVRALLRARGLLMDLERAHTDLTARNEELQLKKTLAQTLVHDLKSPLSAILGNLDLLEMRSEERLRYLVQRSRQGAARMLKMIMNLMDVEGLEEGRLLPAIEPFDATDLARRTLAETGISAEQKKVSLVLEEEGPVWIDGDAVLIRRVLDNLLANAISKSPTGARVRVDVLMREEGGEIAVSDEGAGIPEEYRERIFEKYAQVQMKKAGESNNRGLGLTFCRLAVEAHGGTIWADEAPAGGARFRLILPAALQHQGCELAEVAVEL